MVRLNVLSPQRQNKKDGRLSNGSGLQKDNPGFNEGVLINGSNNKAVQRGIYRERDHPSKRIRRARFLFSKTMEELSCIAQQYAWGKLGVDSEVARFKKGANDDFVVNPEAPYSELWMGTHVSGPSAIKSTSESLAAYLLRNPALVGYSPKDYPSNDLAFLFKVLSIRTALSIQAHPDKALAAQLFQKFPHIYKDANHKPEMAIALTPFEAMCGFRPVSEITAFIADYPELKRILEAKAIDSLQKISDEDSMESKQEAIKALFHSFMKCDDITVNEQIRIMISRLQEKTSQERSELETLILRLHADYPNDRGVFCPLLLNTLTLKAGESFFMGANEPHAYISGDCIECMALSDNVVRAGLTPKFKDADTLMNMLHFRCGKMSSFIEPVAIDAHTLLYRPPADVCAEFEVTMTTLPVGTASYSPMMRDCASIVIVTRGSGVATCAETEVALRPGVVLFLGANKEMKVNTAGSSEDLVFFRAHVNLGQRVD